MNILYITALPGLVSAGPSWSVPASIKAQNEIDNCLWVNLTDKCLEHWKNVECYHNIHDFAEKFELSAMPVPFNHPDLVVFEDFYEIQPPIIARKLRHANIPYIIVPRGALTKKAQNNESKWKKVLANAFIFKRYAKKALAIQFLTKNEAQNTGKEWYNQSFILPNGFSTPKSIKKSFSADKINATFIGRLDIFHKGIDILIHACSEMSDDLRSSNFKLRIYGPKNKDYEIIQLMINEKGLNDIISLKGETSGEAKEEALLKTDLFVLTSRFEGHPMGLIEALAYGVPALVTPGTNMGEEIANADAGWVCNEASKEAIKLQLQNILKEKTLFVKKGMNAIKLAKNYDWEVLAKKFHNEVEQILTI